MKISHFGQFEPGLWISDLWWEVLAFLLVWKEKSQSCSKLKDSPKSHDWKLKNFMKIFRNLKDIYTGKCLKILSMIWLWTLKNQVSWHIHFDIFSQKPVSLNMKMLYFRRDPWQNFHNDLRCMRCSLVYSTALLHEQPAGDKVIIHLVRSFVSVYFTDTFS